MNCSVAIQFLPMDATTDDETCSAIEGDYDACMECLKNCQLVAAKAGCRHMMTYAKIDYRPDGDVMSTDHKIGKYHPTDTEFSHAKSEVA